MFCIICSYREFLTSHNLYPFLCRLDRFRPSGVVLVIYKVNLKIAQIGRFIKSANNSKLQKLLYQSLKSMRTFSFKKLSAFGYQMYVFLAIVSGKFGKLVMLSAVRYNTNHYVPWTPSWRSFLYYWSVVLCSNDDDLIAYHVIVMDICQVNYYYWWWVDERFHGSSWLMLLQNIYRICTLLHLSFMRMLGE